MGNTERVEGLKVSLKEEKGKKKATEIIYYFVSAEQGIFSRV